MAVRWRETEVVHGAKRLRFPEGVVAAGELGRWVVVCTRSRICFYGDEDMVLARPVRAAVVKREAVYYHNRENNHVMALVHPLEPEEFVFFRHGFALKEVVSGVMVLEGAGEYLLKSVGHGRAEAQDGVRSSCESAGDDGFEEVSKTRMLTIYEGEGGMRCVVEDCSEGHGRGGGVNVEVVDYDGFMVGIHGRNVSFIRLGGSRGGVKRSKLLSETNVRLSREAGCVMKYRMQAARGRWIELLRINDTLFLGSEAVCLSIERSVWPRSEAAKGWRQDVYRPFWRGLSRVEKSVLGCYPRAMQRVFLGAFLRCKEKRFDLLELCEDTLSRIDGVLSEWFARCKSVWEFLNMELPWGEGVGIVSRCKEAVGYTCPLLGSSPDVMRMRYRRIMRCDVEIVRRMRYSAIGNLAYRVIYMEMRKDEVLKGMRPMGAIWKLCKAMERHFGDPRMEEVLSLFDEKPRVFEIDEYDLESRKEKGYVMRRASSIGRAYLFYGTGMVQNRYEAEPLRFPIYKNGELGRIEIKEGGWDDWPRFNHSVYRGCGLALSDEVSHGFVESRIEGFASTDGGDEFEVAGIVFAFGLQGRLGEIRPERITQLVEPRHAVISMALLAGAGISQMGRRDDLLGRVYLHYLKSAQPLYVHVGCIVGLGMLYAGSGNVLVRDVLSGEADKQGVFGWEQYNRGNKVWYDYTYRVIASLSISMLYTRPGLDTFRFIELKDSFCELLANGSILFGTKQRKFMGRLRRSDSNRPEEVLYSELFLLGVAMEQDLAGVVKEVRQRCQEASLYDTYRLSGKIMYVGAYAVYKDMAIDLEGSLFKAMVEVCLLVERAMKDNGNLKVLFDACVVSLSLVSNSSCSLDVIRILRRQIKMTETGRLLSEQTDFFFTSSRCKQETQLTMRYGDIERYKLCLGIVTCGMGALKIAPTPHLIVGVVTTFFVSFPISTVDQEYFNMARYFLLLSVKEGPNSPRSTMKYLKMRCKGSKSKMMRDMSAINKIFRKEYSEASDADKKLIIDVLTDFYEQHANRSNLLDIEMLKNIACRMP